MNPKEVYLLILIPNEKKIDFIKLKYESKISPKIFFLENLEKEDDTYLAEIVFKFSLNKENYNEVEKLSIKFSEGNNVYITSFDIKNKSFIFSPKLIKTKKNLDMNESIAHDLISLYNKFNIFLEALEKNNENDKIEKLVIDNIEFMKKYLYLQKKNFFLINKTIK